MDMRPIELLEKKYGSRYTLVVALAKRAMRIKEGSPVLVETDAKNPLTIAILEMAAQKVFPKPPEEQPEEEEAAEEEQQEAEATEDQAE